ncbi:Alpha/Beta hydrolase protein [Aspergillus stella-maris]|uniref:Alpha/Beta hydrolase protein n=1 Tax=Aspergillus stella-maris TaxID=1810926 RepID=UPI003CCDA1A8
MKAELSVYLGLWLVANLGLATPALTSSAPIVDLPYARYQGIRNTNLRIDGFYGLPYAAPPTGTLCWRAPVSIEKAGILATDLAPKKTVLNATSPGTICMQGKPIWLEQLDDLASADGMGDSGVGMVQSEDCLHLDVIVPSEPVSSSLPVIVMIHGGGYATGSSLDVDGSQFVSAAQGHVNWVQIQYRLGVYGFLESKILLNDGVVNVGLLDQRAALEWVQRNIVAFGGDPTRVTIWGVSAGGGSVTSQMMLYGGGKLPFRAAIAENPWWQPLHGNEVLKAQFKQVLKASGCTNLACLRCLPAGKLANASALVYALGWADGTYGFGDYYFGPCVDGEIIQDLPSLEFAKGRFTKVPLLVDHNAKEGWSFTNFSIASPSEVKADLQQLWPDAGPSFFNRLLNTHYPWANFTGSFWDDPFYSSAANTVPSPINNSAFYQRAETFGDAVINCPTHFLSNTVSDARLPVYKMRFAAGLQIHGATSSFLLFANEANSNATLAAVMKAYLLSFALELDPNVQRAPSSPFWPLYANSNAGELNAVQVDNEAINTIRDKDASSECDFLHRQPYSVRN